MKDYIGSKKVEKSLHKWELISSHTGRKTFITLSLNKGVSVQTLSVITHNGNVETMIKKYYKAEDSLKISELNKAWES